MTPKKINPIPKRDMNDKVSLNIKYPTITAKVKLIPTDTGNT